MERLFSVPSGSASVLTAQISQIGGRGMPPPLHSMTNCVPPLIRPLRDHHPPGEGYFPYRREVFGKSGTTPPQSWLVPRQLPLHREAFALPVMRLQCSKNPRTVGIFQPCGSFYVLIFPTIRPWDILPGRFFRPRPPPRWAYPPHRSRRTTGQRNGAPPPGPCPRRAAPPR